MKTIIRAIAAGLVALACGGAAATPDVKAAADRFVPDVIWLAPSVLAGDFSCAGTQQQAILGRTAREVVVAVFTQGLDKAPEVLRFDSADRKPAAAKIRVEDNSLTPDEVKTLAGSAPPGYAPSATCQGLRLSDDAADAAHIYWDRKAKHLDSWAQ